MRDLCKTALSVLAALTVYAGASNIITDTAYAESEKIIDLDLSECNAGDYIPDSVGLGTGNTKKFKVIDESVSKTGKAVQYSSSASDLNNNSEIYFHVPEINTTDVSEPTDYYVDIKLMHYPVGSSVDTGMVVKYVFYNSEKTTSSDRLFFAGFGGSGAGVRANAGNGGGYAAGYAAANEWYRLIYDIHIEPDASKDCVNLKMYKVGETEPEGWQTTLTSDNFGSAGFNNTNNIDLVGLKAYKSLMQFADFAIYKYTEEDFTEYDRIRSTISEASEKIKQSEISYDEAVAVDDEVSNQISSLEGILGRLADEAWSAAGGSITESRNNVETAQGIIAEISEAEITEGDYEYLYSRLEAARKAIDGIVFADKAGELTNELDSQEERLIDFAMKNFSAREHFGYSDGYTLESTAADSYNGWAEGWRIDSGNAVIEEGTLNAEEGFSASRALSKAVTYNAGRKYYLSWTMTADGKAGIDIGGIKAGVTEINGKLYPEIDGSVGTAELDKQNKFILVIDMENSEYGLYIYSDGSEPKTSYYAVSPMVNTAAADTVGIYADSGTAKFDDIELQMCSASYGREALDKTFEAYAAPYSTDEEIQSKSDAVKIASASVGRLWDGILKTYLSYVCNAAEKDAVGALAEGLFETLDNSLTLENAEAMQSVIDGISNSELKKEYQDRLDAYYAQLETLTPVIEGVGISGILKAGNTVSVVIKSVDNAGNGADPIITWYIDGKKLSENKEELFIKSEWAGASIYCTVTPTNKDGAEGVPVTSQKGNILSSGNGSGSSGGSGGTRSTSYGSAASYVPSAYPADTAVSENNTEKFGDVKNHWAKAEIYRAEEKGIVNGVSPDRFEPDREITRAEFVKMIAGALKLSLSDTDTMYKDVSGDAWYAPYISAATKAGIVSGEDGLFRPDDTINRQEAAKIAVLSYRSVSAAVAEAESVTYSDSDEISGWAREYVYECTRLGIMNGIGGNIFSPASGTTRAQAVVTVMRLMDLTDADKGEIK